MLQTHQTAHIFYHPSCKLLELFRVSKDGKVVGLKWVEEVVLTYDGWDFYRMRCGTCCFDPLQYGGVKNWKGRDGVGLMKNLIGNCWSFIRNSLFGLISFDSS